MNKIIIVNAYSPIDARFDWCAFHEGDDGKSWHRGWGATKAEALESLARLDLLIGAAPRPPCRSHQPGE